MNRKSISILLLCGMAGLVSSAGAAELITTIGQGKGNRTAISFDLVSERQVAAFNFEIAIPGLQPGSVTVGSCGAELPAGFDAKCHAKEGAIMMYAVSSDPNVGIGPGIAGVGTIELRGVAMSKGSFQVTTLEAYDQAGNSLGLTSRLSTDSDSAVAK